ncbi:hypothetical protein T484DRAFT_1769392 [Baffinella frigidus]|nr:hypothetical protein T484DRAFT_1769392 [Cryptophyta sp. CCMP2293]
MDKILFLVCLATSGWAVTDFYLFSKVAVKEQLDKTGQFRSATISSAFLTRTQMITAFEGNAEKFKDVQATIARDMVTL